ncbi:MAG: alginate lyase family protein [Akkermansiaceae bacterium]
MTILIVLATLGVCRGEKPAPQYFAVEPTVLKNVRERFAAGDPLLRPAMKALLKDAEKALKTRPPSVTDKPKPPVSGDKHDYMTAAPYFWPDSAKPGGLPYIGRDGKVNPEVRTDAYDHNRINLMAGAVEDLALAYYFTGNERYAEKAADFLRVWFLDPATRMNPHLNFAQAIPGKNTGRGIGIIEGRNLSEAADAAGLLAGSPAWTTKDDSALKQWLASFLEWMMTSKNGLEEAAAKNNHGSVYDAQIMRIALILDRTDLAKKIAESVLEKRVAVQIEPDGRQPLELKRTTSLGYSRFNLVALFDLASMAGRVGVDLWHHQTVDGRSIRKAFDYLVPHMGATAKKWPYTQIKPIDQADFAPLLRQAAAVYGDPKYTAILVSLGDISSKRVELLYPPRSPAREVAALDRARILKAADASLSRGTITITQFPTKLSEGGSNDFYSNGDYWWPDPTKPDGLPYIRRDGETNPENFSQHRMAIRDLRDSVAALAAAYQITQDERYAIKAAGISDVFFLDSATRMNPHLQYAQAIPGVSPGRGIGIIDTLHLIEIPMAIEAMKDSSAFPKKTLAGLEKWFADYLDWMLTSDNGKEEAATKNNHAVAFWLQAAVFARFTGNEKCLAECRRQFKEVFVPEQMAVDGSFPAELARTKPYAYSIFQLDNMAALCQVLSTPEENLWQFELPDGRGIGKAAAYLFPYLADKSKWPLKPDVASWDGWPARQPSLVFAGFAREKQAYLELWQKLPPDPTDPEVQRNIAITQPLIWLKERR